MVTGARKSGNEEDREERREESRIKEEKERKGRNRNRKRGEGRKSISLCTRSAGQTFQDIESFLGLLTSEKKVYETAEE